MKKLLCALLLMLTIYLLSACSSSEPKLGPGDMLDNDTGEIYSLGMSKEDFDAAFNTSAITEEGNTVKYLSGILKVAFDGGKASEIECSGNSNRFSFYNFDFGMDISQIEGRYEKFDGASGYVFYSRYYDLNGKDVPIIDAEISAQLMVRDGDSVNRKDGQYINYRIAVESYDHIPDSTDSPESKTSNNTLSTEEPNLSLEDMAALIEAATSPNYQHVTVDAKDNVVTINIWQDGLAQAVASIKVSGGDSSNANWITVKDGLIAMSSAAHDLLDAHGFGDVLVSLNVLNDEDLSKVLLSIVNSVVVLDVLES